MRKDVFDSLGREWKVTVEKEISKLKQSDRLLLGNIAAVFVRSDSFLGRPEVDCSDDNELVYAVFYPSKYSVVCNKDFETKANPCSRWRLMSLNNFVEQVLEFNFTYLQLLFNGGTIYETEDIVNIRKKVENMLTEEYNRERFLSKQVSLLYGVLKDFNNGKFGSVSCIQDRLFLAYKVDSLLRDFMKTNKLNLTKKLDLVEYHRVVENGLVNGRVKENILTEFNRKTAEYSNKEQIGNIRLIDKDKYKCYKLETKYELMKDIVLSRR